MTKYNIGIPSGLGNTFASIIRLSPFVSSVEVKPDGTNWAWVDVVSTLGTHELSVLTKAALLVCSPSRGSFLVQEALTSDMLAAMFGSQN